MYVGMAPVTPSCPRGRGSHGQGEEESPQVIPFSSSQKITDNIKGKVCSLAVCAVAWLVAHVRMLGLDEREKSLQMIRQLAGPLYSENTLQFYNERSVTWPALPGPGRCVVGSWHHQEQTLGRSHGFPGSCSATTSSSIQAPTSPPCLAADACTFRVAGLSLPPSPSPTAPSHSQSHIRSAGSADTWCVSLYREGFNPCTFHAWEIQTLDSLTSVLQGCKFQKTS